jgi:hypothetical protein
MDIKDLIKIKIEDSIKDFEKIGINDNWTINKSNIHNYLIEPRFEEYIDIKNNKIMLWTVLEGDDFGYKIVYSEKDDNFGLAMISIEDEKIFLGTYGSFGKTLYSM